MSLLITTNRDPESQAQFYANVPPAQDADDFENIGTGSPSERRRQKNEKARQTTDLALAKLFVAMCGDRIRFVQEQRLWLVYDGTRWIAGRERVMQLAMAMDDELWKQANEQTDPADADAFKAMAKRASSKGGLAAIIGLAESLPDIAISAAELDTDPWLLNCPNGTINLHTGVLLPHRQADMLTQLCPVSYDRNARNADWDSFLEAVAGPELRGFLQRLAGMCLTGDVSEQKLHILVGGGSNGKTTFLNALCSVLGPDYAIKCDHRLLLAGNQGRHTTERMDLYRKRLVIASETEEGERLAEAQIKELTGGEPIRGRRVKQDSWEYMPTHTLLVATNHPPEIHGTDHALWRRLTLVEFLARFWDPDRGEQGEPHLRVNRSMATLLEAARPAILAWAVQGCLDWQYDGLGIPAVVQQATAEYRVNQDRIAAFINDCCVRTPGARSQSGQLYAAYRDWCAENCENAMTGKSFSSRMRTLFPLVRSNGSWFVGVTLQ